MVIAARLPFGLHGIKTPHLPLVKRRMKISECQIALDGILRDPLFYQIHRLHAGLPGNIRLRLAKLMADPVEIIRPALAQMPAIAPRPAGTDRAGLQNHSFDAGLGKRQCRRNAGQAATYDRHISVDLADGMRVGRAVAIFTFVDAATCHQSALSADPGEGGFRWFAKPVASR